jgi:hypothetical protein
MGVFFQLGRRRPTPPSSSKQPKGQGSQDLVFSSRPRPIRVGVGEGGEEEEEEGEEREEREEEREEGTPLAFVVDAFDCWVELGEGAGRIELTVWLACVVVSAGS